MLGLGWDGTEDVQGSAPAPSWMLVTNALYSGWIGAEHGNLSITNCCSW